MLLQFAQNYKKPCYQFDCQQYEEKIRSHKHCLEYKMIFIFGKYKFTPMLSIEVKDQVIDFIKEGKTKEAIDHLVQSLED